MNKVVFCIINTISIFILHQIICHMNKNQRSKLDACNRVKEFNKKYATELAAIVEYAAEAKAFDDALVIIKDASLVQSVTVGTRANEVVIAKQTMANLVVKYAMRGMVKAKQLGNLNLANHLNHPVTYIMQANKTLAINRSTEMKNQLSSNLALLTNITAANITEIETAIAAYDALKDKAIIENHKRIATGTNPLPLALTTATEAMENMFTLVDSYYSSVNPTLVDELALAKQIIHAGVYSTGITGTITQDNNVVKNAVVTILGTTKKVTTNAEGQFSIIKLKPGTHSVETILPNGDKQTKQVTVAKSTIETVDFAF